MVLNHLIMKVKQYCKLSDGRVEQCLIKPSKYVTLLTFYSPAQFYKMTRQEKTKSGIAQLSVDNPVP
jgi:hypothetical protein